MSDGEDIFNYIAPDEISPQDDDILRGFTQPAREMIVNLWVRNPNLGLIRAVEKYRQRRNNNNISARKSRQRRKEEIGKIRLELRLITDECKEKLKEQLSQDEAVNFIRDLSERISKL